MQFEAKTKVKFLIYWLIVLFYILHFPKAAAKSSETEPTTTLTNFTNLPNLQNFTSLLNTSTDNATKSQVINHWADLIKIENYTDIYSFFKNYSDSKTNQKILNDYLYPLIQQVYTVDRENGTKVQMYSEENFDKIIKFLLGLPNSSSQVYGYIALQNYLLNFTQNHSSEMLRLTFIVKNVLNVTQYDGDLKEMEPQLLTLYNHLPQIYRQIIWQDTCHIKNYHWREYLYGSNVKLPATHQKGVYTWIEGDKVEEGQWKLEPVENATYFHIVNHYWRKGTKKYLCDDWVQANNKTAVIMCSKNTVEYEQIQWRLEPVVNQNNKLLFKIYRRQYDERLEDNEPKLILIAGGDDERRDDERRFVFTKLMSSTPSEGFWQITCSTEKPHYPIFR